jgi:hypothetical protein
MISSLAVSLSKIRVNGYCDGKFVEAATSMVADVLLIATDSVVLAAVEE